MPRGRPDPFSQVADGGCFHLVPGLQILEQDRAQLDEPQCRLASGDYGVHARAIPVVWADTTVAVAVQRRGVAARTAVTLAGDEIDERCFISLLHGLPLSVTGQGPNGTLGAVSFRPKAQERGFWHSIRGQTSPAKRGDHRHGHRAFLRTPCLRRARRLSRFPKPQPQTGRDRFEPIRAGWMPHHGRSTLSVRPDSTRRGRIRRGEARSDGYQSGDAVMGLRGPAARGPGARSARQNKPHGPARRALARPGPARRSRP